nr:subtilisin GX {N-terminal} [Bacillus sp. (in: firmicutes)]
QTVPWGDNRVQAPHAQ